MEERKTYRTLLQASEGFYSEKGSKFFGFAIPCTREEQVKEQLSTWRKEHPQACHVCFAFRLGSDLKKYRSSDDGEPNNSAGAPILGQIQSFELTNVLIGVVRYYGGTNLGVGGLVQAYKTAAREAISAATIVEKEDHNTIEIHFTYEVLPKVMSLIKTKEIDIISQQLELECTIRFTLPTSNSQLISQLETINGLMLNNYGIEK